MNIVQIGTSLSDWGGIERYVLYLQTALHGAGHSVTVLAPAGSRLADLTAAQPMQLDGKHRFSQIPELVRHFRAGHYDVAHVHYSPDFVVPGIAARLAKIPTRVMTRHLATRWSHTKARLYSGLWPQIIAVSDATRSALIQSGIPSGRVTTAYAGIPDFPAATPHSFGDGFHFGFFGRLVPEKGVDVLIRAASQLPSGIIHIFGDGESRGALEASASSLGKRVVFHGKVADVQPYVAGVSAVVIPSIWAEPFPYSGLEAMALSRAVIASNTGGLPEMVRNGIDGWITVGNDSSSLAAAMREALNDPRECKIRGEHGRSRQRAEFTLEQFAERVLEIYRADNHA